MKLEITRIDHVVYFPPMLTMYDDASMVEYWNIGFKGYVSDINFKGKYRMNDDPESYTIHQIIERIQKEFNHGKTKT